MKTISSPVLLSLTLIISCLYATGSAVAQGSLTPPPGVPAPAMKTLDQVQPCIPVNTLPGDATATHVISVPGSYYLTANLYGNSTKDGIRVDVANVTIDLNGFDLEAVSGATNGIFVNANGPIVIRNGQMRFWPHRAIIIPNNSEFTIEDITISNSGAAAIDASGSGTIENVSVRAAVGYGIRCPVANNVRIHRCRVEGITDAVAGISAPNATVSQCAVANLTGATAQVAGISTVGGYVEECSVRGVTNTGAGSASGVEGAASVTDSVVAEISATAAVSGADAFGLNACGTVSGCSVRAVASAGALCVGIYGTATHVSGSRVKDMTALTTFSGIPVGNTLGIRGGLVIDCMVEAGAASASSVGIDVDTRNVAKRNFVMACEKGIVAMGTSCLVAENTLVLGFSYGVETRDAAVVEDNAIESQTGTIGFTYGIYIQADGFQRIARNHVAHTSVGVKTTGLALSLLIQRNSAEAFTLTENVYLTPLTLGTHPTYNIDMQ